MPLHRFAPAVALVSALVLAACGEATPPAASADILARGEATYRAHCAACHGANREGQPDWRQRKADGRLPAPPHDDSGHTWHHPNAQLFAITKFGLVPPNAPPGYVSDMPAYAGKLADDEIRAVLAFIESRWSPAVRRMRAERLSP